MTNSVENIVDGIIDFCAYVEDFYGVGGIYDMGATPAHIIEAVQKYVDQVGTNPEDSFSFAGDSLDREKVRDIMIEDFGLVFPESNSVFPKIIIGVDDYEPAN